MVDPKFCVSYIWSTLKYKISVGEVVGHAYPNEDSKSKYLYVNDTIDGSIYRFVRTSDHNINILKTLAHKKQPWLYDNVNIEFRDKIRINNKEISNSMTLLSLNLKSLSDRIKKELYNHLIFTVICMIVVSYLKKMPLKYVKRCFIT